MQIERLTIKNFRNLPDVDIALNPSNVIVGENRSGKTNLLHALRLVLDPGLSNLERQLSSEDFWDGLSDGDPAWDPMECGEVIEIGVEFGGITEEDDLAMASLGDALIEAEPLRARLVYRFAPLDTGNDVDPPSYTWAIHGGLDEKELRGDTRRFLRQLHLHALRDVERDINSWRRSPLRPLLIAAADKIETDKLNAVAEAISEANDQVADLEPISQLATSISERMIELVGRLQAPQTSLAVGPTDPRQLLRSLRVFVEEAARPLRSSSLGTLNVLYLALLDLELERALHDAEIAHMVLSMEEPEAHLHPHLQRLVFADILRVDATEERSVLVTTHSPHVVSVAPPSSIIVLRRREDGGSEVSVASDAELDEWEWGDIERYIDATRGEIVFARRVILVEGFAELVLVPRLAEELDLDLDELGVTVCAVHGAHFASYCTFLHALGIRWCVITDGDPDGTGRSRGARRARRLMAKLHLDGGDPAEVGIFVGTSSFEDDLSALQDNAEPMIEAFRSLGPTAASADRLDRWAETGEITRDDLRKTLKHPGKGRFAQRLAESKADLALPTYIEAAIKYSTNRE